MALSFTLYGMLFYRIGFAIATLGFLFVVGCHSTPLKAPPASGPETAEQLKWQSDYRQAQATQVSDTPQACRLFSDLAALKRFPAHQLAEVRAAQTCVETTLSQFDRAQVPSYLQDLALDVSLKIAAQQKDSVAEMELALEKSKTRLPQSEKVKWIELAIARASSLKDDKQIEALNERLYQIAPRLDPHPRIKDFLKVAADFRLARDFKNSRKYYERVVKNSHSKIEDKIAALKGLRLASKNARQKSDFLVACDRLSKFLNSALKKKPRSKTRSNMLRVAAYDADVYHARALWTQGKSTAAHHIFDRLEKQMKGKVSIAELYWLKARMAEEDKNYAEVSRLLDLSLLEKSNDSNLRDKILWYSAWNERQMKNLDEAAKKLRELDEQTQIDFVRVRALFWLGKTLSEANKEDEAKVVFERLMDLDPLGYYGLLAHRHLDRPITFGQSSAEDGPTLAKSNVPLDPVLAEWLNLLDEKDVLTALLNESSTSYRRQKDQNDEGWIQLFKFYAKAGLYMKLYESLGNLTPERRKTVLENHPELLFPQPWSDDVKTASLQFGVQSELIYSIMRQESAFDPRARSLADAFGLLQVLPEVAEKVSRENEIPYSDMQDLYVPQTNILVGAAHIRDLLKRNNGQFILAVASYNANERVIHNWMKTRFHGDALEFIEEIPYEETRVYVRLVMRNLIFYSLLNSKSASIDFPAWVLKLDAT